jgi:hypothetical protein
MRRSSSVVRRIELYWSRSKRCMENEQVAVDFSANRLKPNLPEVIIEAVHEAVEKRQRRANSAKGYGWFTECRDT